MRSVTSTSVAFALAFLVLAPLRAGADTRSCTGGKALGDGIGGYRYDAAGEVVRSTAVGSGESVAFGLSEMKAIVFGPDHSAIGWLFFDQHGAPFIQLKRDAPDRYYRMFKVQRIAGKDSDTWLILDKIPLPKPLTIQRCSP
jgi:hypothetical protein